MIVAYKVPHNEGVEAGIIAGPGFDTESHAQRARIDALALHLRDECGRED